MKRNRGAVTSFLLALSTMIMFIASVGWAAAQSDEANANQSDIEKRIKNAATVLDEIMGVKDKAIPDKIMSDAKCVAVVPHMIKGGFVFGAEGGRGVVTCRTGSGWSAPAFFAITGGSWGLQIGVEGVDLVMIIQNEQGMQHLLSNKFQIGADASAAAGAAKAEWWRLRSRARRRRGRRFAGAGVCLL